MRFEDPLDRWLAFLPDEEEMDPRYVEQTLERLRQSLDLLGEVLAEAPTDRRPDYYQRHHELYGAQVLSVVLPPGERERVEQLYRQVMQRGGSGGPAVQEALLDMLGITGDAATLPFWEELLALRRARDTFSNTRRTYALAALALLFITRGELSALKLMQGALGHSTADTRAMAAYYLGRACRQTTDPVPDPVAQALAGVAAADRSFAPRFMARRALTALDRALPPEHPGGAYAFKVWHTHDVEVYRVIEVSSQQTLADLHHAIQEAWGWDDDHLYSFYLNNRRYDPRYEFDHELTDPAPAYAHQVRIGDLGLRRRHRLLYLFDFGDNHAFQVVVTSIRAEAGAGTLPRVVEAVGEAMPQYQAYR